jgi:hypothetical protein
MRVSRPRLAGNSGGRLFHTFPIAEDFFSYESIADVDHFDKVAKKQTATSAEQPCDVATRHATTLSKARFVVIMRTGGSRLIC